MSEKADLQQRVRERLMPTFLAVRDECVAGLQLAGDVRDVDQASFWAHKLISSTNTMGHYDIAHLCMAVEQSVEDGAAWTDISDPVALICEMARAIG